ncbi:MAG: hypothetical protein K2M87_00170, partial [Muribaculaceae bacterium]|nr:hypothetical protein [Muribaculaceae bacterium]
IEYSEFLINYQGGFVRRGLIGEVLYQFYSFSAYPIIPVISCISYVAFFFVIIYFFHKFRKYNYSWWILLSPLFLGYTNDIVRKDYLLYCVLIGIITLLRYSDTGIIKRIFACVLITFGLFMHEAFIFWGFPIYALILNAKQYHKILNWILICIPLIQFGVLCLFKGTPEIAQHIADSWNSVNPGKALYSGMPSAIGAIGWNAQDTFIMHLKYNFAVAEGGYGFILLPMIILAAYYMFTNFFFVFDKNPRHNTFDDKLALSLLYSLLVICMIPMFTVLSCDTGRNMQYLSVGTFAAFVIIPNKSIISSFPIWYKMGIIKINNYLDRILQPRRGVLIFMLLLLAISPYHLKFSTCWEQSVVGTLFSYIFKCVEHIF